MPAWTYKIDLKAVFHNDEMTLRESRWVKDKDVSVDVLPGLVEDLAEIEDPDQFDEVWNWVYDEADAGRAWIATV